MSQPNPQAEIHEAFQQELDEALKKQREELRKKIKNGKMWSKKKLLELLKD